MTWFELNRWMILSLMCFSWRDLCFNPTEFICVTICWYLWNFEFSNLLCLFCCKIHQMIHSYIVASWFKSVLLCSNKLLKWPIFLIFVVVVAKIPLGLAFSTNKLYLTTNKFQILPINYALCTHFLVIFQLNEEHIQENDIAKM